MTVVTSIADLEGMDFSRIAIIGSPGSGKTTLSNSLSDILHRQVVHLDRVLWQSNWQMPDYDTRAEIHQEIVEGDTWIVDGMWRSHLVDRFRRATLVIFLDYKRSLCMRRVIKRRLKYGGKQRDDIAEGCYEKLDGEFLRYVWTFRKKVRPQIFQLMQQNPQTQVLVFNSPKQTMGFLQILKQHN